MKLSAGFKPAPVPALTPASYQAFQAKSFFANGKLKIQILNFTISKLFLIFLLIIPNRCFEFFK